MEEICEILRDGKQLYEEHFRAFLEAYDDAVMFIDNTDFFDNCLSDLLAESGEVIDTTLKLDDIDEVELNAVPHWMWLSEKREQFELGKTRFLAMLVMLHSKPFLFLFDTNELRMEIVGKPVPEAVADTMRWVGDTITRRRMRQSWSCIERRQAPVDAAEASLLIFAYLYQRLPGDDAKVGESRESCSRHLQKSTTDLRAWCSELGQEFRSAT